MHTAINTIDTIVRDIKKIMIIFKFLENLKIAQLSKKRTQYSTKTSGGMFPFSLQKCRKICATPQ